MPAPTKAEEDAGKKPTPLSAQKAVILAWIKAGAPAPTNDVRWPFISDPDLIGAIVTDLRSIRSQQERRQTLYLSLAVQHNTARDKDSDMELYRQAIRKLLNSLSWEPELVQPLEIGPGKVLFRINLRALGWNAPLWEQIISQYPYGVDYEDDDFKLLSTLTGSALCFVRADWFTTTASHRS